MPFWTHQRLQQIVAKEMAGTRFLVVSNREPYIHTRANGMIECMRPASGMATALDPILKASGGVWIAHGSGDADRLVVDARDHVRVPPEDPSYTLRRVWLPKKLEQEYYYGLSNEGLWPLCHVAFQRPEFQRSQWESYRAANEIFAEAVLEEAQDGPAFVFIQDYHFGLLPRILKNRNPQIAVAQFWHIPWPNRETFRAFPWKEELLDGMLGNDLLGFHLRYHCTNFLETIDRNIEALVDTEKSTIVRGGHTTSVRPFPISIDFQEHTKLAGSVEVAVETEAWMQRLGGRPRFLGLGIDRVDYTKGIAERIHAIDALLEQHPEYINQLCFVQIGVPSRTAIGSYEDLNRKIAALIDSVNRKWQRGRWQPIWFVHQHVDQPGLMALHKLADFCLVSSLHDGMNLVAKEFVASRTDEDGVLILSRFTGSARELTDALLVNPFATEEIAGAIHTALMMTPDERKRRMRRMRAAVEHNNIYRWAGKMLEALLRIDIPEAAHEPCVAEGAAA
jgi:alpha,alpha-trehalose-phosphate synthase [UDP-forming]